MARDSSRSIRRAGLILLKADADLAAIVMAASIYPGIQPTNASWPFVRWGVLTATPVRAAGVDGLDATVMVHGFAMSRETASRIVESAEDHAYRIGEAIAAALDRKNATLDTDYPATCLFRWTGATTMRDRDEAGAWHTSQSFRIRVIS